LCRFACGVGAATGWVCRRFRLLRIDLRAGREPQLTISHDCFARVDAALDYDLASTTRAETHGTLLDGGVGFDDEYKFAALAALDSRRGADHGPGQLSYRQRYVD